MNISKLVTRIKMQIGIYGVALPIDNLDEIITDIIRDITLPVFSTYCPYLIKSASLINCCWPYIV